MPFYFHFDLPEGHDTGLLALQRTGILGIHQTLYGLLDKEFRESFPDHRLFLNLAVPKQVIEQYAGKDSDLTEIHFIRHSLSDDIGDSVLGGKQVEGTMELGIKIRETGFPIPEPIRRIVRSGSPGDLLELFDVDFQYDSVKIKTRTDGREKTINVADPRRGLRADYDVTEREVSASLRKGVRLIPGERIGVAVGITNAV